jgi:phage terminase small subunit
MVNFEIDVKAIDSETQKEPEIVKAPAEKPITEEGEVESDHKGENKVNRSRSNSSRSRSRSLSSRSRSRSKGP